MQAIGNVAFVARQNPERERESERPSYSWLSCRSVCSGPQTPSNIATAACCVFGSKQLKVINLCAKNYIFYSTAFLFPPSLSLSPPSHRSLTCAAGWLRGQFIWRLI